MKNKENQYIEFANLRFLGLTKKIVLEESSKIKFLVTVNSEFIINANKNLKFKNIINKNYATFDGEVPYRMAKRRNKKIYFEKLSGSDLIYDFCKMAQQKNKRIFLLGGFEKSNKDAVSKLKEQYRDLQIEGYSPPYKPYPFEKQHNQMILSKINDFQPDILFVGFGAMKQEYWINENKNELEKIGIRWVIGSGGTFEFVAGTIKRAPLFFQKAGLEGIWRLIHEPKWFRFKRILISFLVFRYL